MVAYKGPLAVALMSSTDLVSLVGPWKLPVMRLLAQVVKAAVGELRSFGGHLHREARRDAVSALLVDQSESLEVPRRKRRGDLQAGAHRKKAIIPRSPEGSSVESRLPESQQKVLLLLISGEEALLGVKPTRSL